MRASRRKPGEGGSQPSIEELLAPMDRDQLRMILLEVAHRYPGVAEQIEELAAVPSPAASPRAPTELPAVAPARVRKQLQTALRAVEPERYYEYDTSSEAVAVLQETAAQARPYLDAGDGRAALVFLEAVAEHATENIEELLGHEGLEIGELFAELGPLLAEAVLLTDASPEERREWVEKIAGWEARAADFGYEESLAVARYAAEQGWDHPPLERVLRGEVTGQGIWEGDAPDAADDLAEVRLKLLDRQRRWDEYLRLAEAEGLTERYVTALVRLDRIPEAVACGLSDLTTREQALTLARSLDAAGASEEALRVAEHALAAFEAGRYASGELPRWARALAARLERPEQALQAALTAMREQCTLSDYLGVQALAGERWPALREELLEQVRRSRSTYPMDEVDILLHEGRIEDAMAAVDAAPAYDLVERVVEAALPGHSEWVFRACRRQFDEIADAGRSQAYYHAVEWLERAKAALQAAGEEDRWRAYLEETIERHKRKYSLRPKLERLR